MPAARKKTLQFRPHECVLCQTAKRQHIDNQALMLWQKGYE
jgi:hypothetical protein